MGLSEAVNELARTGLAASKEPEPYVQRTERVGIKVDVTDIGAVLDLLDEG